MTQRPAKLHLLPEELYPATRMLTDEIPDKKVVIDDMPQMVSFVYEMYMQKIKSFPQPVPEVIEVSFKCKYFLLCIGINL